MGWVYTRVALGWVGLGMGRTFLFLLGWVGHGCEMACLRKQMSSTSSTYATLCCQAIILLRENLHLHLLYCVLSVVFVYLLILGNLWFVLVMMCASVSSYARPFVVRYIWWLDPDGLGWVMGPEVHLAVGWIGLGQLFGGLG